MVSNNSRALVVANWKMNLSLADSLVLMRSLAVLYKKNKLDQKLELALCPTFPALTTFAAALKQTEIKLGAQDVFWKPVGPYTGEVSPRILAELGVKYVIVGHSERRQFLKETDIMIQQKLAASSAEGLIPILCVGETLEQRRLGQKNEVIAHQLISCLKGIVLPDGMELVVAYEPVWAIGSGHAVAAAEAGEMGLFIKKTLASILPTKVVNKQVRIIYGGSVDVNNINDFIGRGTISGVLVGGASLDARKFIDVMMHIN